MKPHVSIMISTALKDSASLCRIFKNKDWKELILDSRSSLKCASIEWMNFGQATTLTWMREKNVDLDAQRRVGNYEEVFE
jgi:hypothetical protein